MMLTLTGNVLTDFVINLGIATGSILVGTQLITAAIHGAFKIENPNWVHAVSWTVAILAGLGFVAFNGLTFGFEQEWLNYLCGGIAGLIAGGAANGWYDWPAIEKIFDVITRIFGGDVAKAKK